MAWRIGSAWRSKSGTKTSLSFSPSILPASVSVSLSLSPTLSRSLISSLEISLRRLSSGKLVTSAGLRQQLFPCTDHSDVEGWGREGREGRGLVSEGGVSEPGGRKQWCDGEAASGRGAWGGPDWREGLATRH